MALLLVDIGNTHTVFALWKEGMIAAKWRMATNPNRTEDEYAVWLLQLLQREALPPEKVQAVVIGSVVPQADFCIRRFSEKYLNITPLVVGQAGVKTGVTVRLPKPQEVGADRLLNALAAWHTYRSAAVVVDFGTATTFDVVSRNGEYVGGVIAPGIQLSLQALHAAAAKLPNIAIAKPEKAIGTSTEGAMQSGIYYGYIGLISGILGRISEEMTEPEGVKVIATGGLAPLFSEAVERIDVLEPDLTLQGLKLIYDMNYNV